jgi:hypothetical protein
VDGISVTLQRGNGTQEKIGEFAVVGAPFIDIVFQLRREVCLERDDELHLDFSVPVVSRVSIIGAVDTETYRYKEDWQYSTGRIELRQIVTHFRFTKIKEDAWLELLDAQPEGLHAPSSDRAVKIR